MATTLPSAGATMASSRMVSFLLGILKNEMTNKRKPALLQK
jgi:hypothetical protein